MRMGAPGTAIGTLAVALVASMVLARPPDARERSAWLEEVESMLRFTGEAYVNLGDRLRDLDVGPGTLAGRMRTAVARARTRDEARRAVEDFAASFRDPHFRVERDPGWTGWPLAAGERAPIPADLPAEAACSRMGFTVRAGAVEWEALPGWRTWGGDSADRPFLAGTVAGPEGLVAVIRIPLFLPTAFPASCREAWMVRLRAGSGPCDGACQDGLRRQVEESLAPRLASQVRELAGAGSRILLVDVTGNGGGSGISDAMARLLTTRPLRDPDGGFVRHPHWELQLEERLRHLDAELGSPGLPGPRGAELERARGRVAAALEEARRRCDLSGIWDQDDARLPCDPVARIPGGSLDAAPRPHPAPAWSGPLLVLVDGRTASSAEQFAAVLRDADAARILGARTWGAGCGHTNGGIRLRLPHLGLRAVVPDCVRLRADGTNEANGIVPDVPVPWQDGDDGATRARRVLQALGG